MNEHRDNRTGRFTHDPAWEPPLPETWPASKPRSTMPANRRKHPDLFTLRMPPKWREKIDFIAETQQKTARQVVLEAIAAVIGPVISEQTGLHDEVRSMPAFLGQNRRLPRLEDERPSNVNREVPKHDHIGTWRAKQNREFGGKLTDRPKR